MNDSYQECVDRTNDLILKMRDRVIIMTITIENNKLKLETVVESISTIKKDLKVKYNSIKRPDQLARSIVSMSIQIIIIIMFLSDDTLSTLTDNLFNNRENYNYNLHLLREKVISKATNGPYHLRWSKKCSSKKLLMTIVSSYYLVNKRSLFYLFSKSKNNKMFFFNNYISNRSEISFTFNIEVTLYTIRLL